MYQQLIYIKCELLAFWNEENARLWMFSTEFVSQVSWQSWNLLFLPQPLKCSSAMFQKRMLEGSKEWIRSCFLGRSAFFSIELRAWRIEFSNSCPFPAWRCQVENFEPWPHSIESLTIFCSIFAVCVTDDWYCNSKVCAMMISFFFCQVTFTC